MKTESIKSFEALSSDVAPANATVPGRVDAEIVRLHIQNAHVERASALGAMIGGAVAALVRGAGRLFRGIGRKVDEVRNIDALNAMDDRMLKDLGIDRSQIPGLVRSSASGVSPYRTSPEVARAANAAGFSNVA